MGIDVSDGTRREGDAALGECICLGTEWLLASARRVSALVADLNRPRASHIKFAVSFAHRSLAPFDRLANMMGARLGYPLIVSRFAR